MPIVSNLSKIMEEMKMTYEELQFLSKVAPDTVARAKDERIATCKLLTLEKLADALGVNVNELFKHVKEQQPSPSEKLANGSPTCRANPEP